MAYTKQNFQDGQILTAANLEKMENGIIAGQGVHNLLDNSDFRIKNNIINTKGLTDYSFDSGNVFDRWRLHWTGDGRVSIKDGYIELYRKTYSTYLFQYPKDLESMIGKTYTVAAKVRYNGYIGWIDSTQRVNSGSLALNDWDIATCTFTVGSATSDIGKAGIEIATKADLSFEVQWVALYEGAYTPSTLPPYIPKGKHVEMLNCNVPLAPHNLLDNSDFRNPVNQRGITSQVGGGYGLDRWRADGSGTISVGSTGVSLTNLSFRQPVPLKAGTYTLAFHLSDGTTLRYIFKFDGADTLNAINSSGNETTGAYINYYKHATGVVMVQIVVAEGYTKIVEWAALYEGSYDASTLPAYQPKGYAAELAECQRYYQQYNIEEMSAVGSYENGNTYIRCQLSTPMRIAPSLVQSSVNMWTTYNSVDSVIQAFIFYKASPQTVNLKCANSHGSSNQLVIATNNAVMGFSADL